MARDPRPDLRRSPPSRGAHRRASKLVQGRRPCQEAEKKAAECADAAPCPTSSPNDRAVVKRVEQELERSVWLGALQNPGAEQQRASLADRRLDRDDPVLEIMLAPRPAAAERRPRVEPR